MGDGKILGWRPSKRTTVQAPPTEQASTTPYQYPVWDEGYRRWVYNSNSPVTPDRWQCAREIRGWSEQDAAEALECDLAHIQAIEVGKEQPTQDELHRYAKWTNFPLIFFWQEPVSAFADPNTFNSLDYHASLTTYVCDPCERATGEEVDAEYRCAECGEDLCAGCAHLYRDGDVERDLCEPCWHKAIGHKAAQTRRTRRTSV